MLDVAFILNQVLEEARQEILDNHDRAGQVASGKTASSLRVEVTPSVVSAVGTIYGRAYFATLETGSKPWANQYKHPPRPFVDVIRQWMDDKGVTGLSAYLVARKIMRDGSKLYRDGSKLYRDGGRTDIFTPPLNDIQRKIDERISKTLETIITETITR